MNPKRWLWLIGLVAPVVVATLAGCGPNCPIDPAYRYDPQSGVCVDLGEEALEKWRKSEATEWYAGNADLYSEPEPPVPVEELRDEAENAPAVCPHGCETPPPGCAIKGNVTFEGSEKIYHVPGCEYYAETRINAAYGERWFCTEAEAIANGWRKAKNCP